MLPLPHRFIDVLLEARYHDKKNAITFITQKGMASDIAFTELWAEDGGQCVRVLPTCMDCMRVIELIVHYLQLQKKKKASH